MTLAMECFDANVIPIIDFLWYNILHVGALWMVPYHNLGLGHLKSPQEAQSFSDRVLLGPDRYASDNSYGVF